MTRRFALYEDPLDRIWLCAAQALGLQIQRGTHAYASTDGHGTLTLAPDEDLDPDDCLAQMILHEICHWLTQGEDSVGREDWGLVNDDRVAQHADDQVREHGCLMLQAAVLRPYGLRRLLAPTTDFRVYYDALPQDPLALPADLADLGDERQEDRQAAIYERRSATLRAIELARTALSLRRRAPFARVLDDALHRTAVVHRAMLGVGVGVGVASGPSSGPSSAADRKLSLWQEAPAPPLHPAGAPLLDGMTEAVAGTCAGCAWRGPGGRAGRCERSGGRAVQADWPACVLYEPALDCQRCGACCREGYDLVPVGRREPVARVLRRRGLLAEAGCGLSLLRADEGRRCAALAGDLTAGYGCTAYEDRPRACRDLRPGGEACLIARQRVGLSY